MCKAPAVDSTRPSAVSLGVLLPYVLGSFAANSLITRYLAQENLLDAGLVSGVRFVSGALALLLLAAALRERPKLGRANLLPALWLGTYAVCISYGYEHIGAAAGTFVFYAMVLVTLVATDLLRRQSVPGRRLLGAGVALAGHFTVLAAVLLLPTVGLLTPAADVTVTWSGLVWATVMGSVTTAFAYAAWYACQRSLTATSAGTVQLVIPVLTAVGAVLLLDEEFTTRLTIAAVLVALGMWLARARPPVADRTARSATPR